MNPFGTIIFIFYFFFLIILILFFILFFVARMQIRRQRVVYKNELQFKYRLALCHDNGSRPAKARRLLHFFSFYYIYLFFCFIHMTCTVLFFFFFFAWERGKGLNTPFECQTISSINYLVNLPVWLIDKRQKKVFYDGKCWRENWVDDFYFILF